MTTDDDNATGGPSVLFLCVHNAGRSQMAAGWLRRLAGDGVTVYSGGSDPGTELNPAAVEVMAEAGIDITAQRPQRWTDEVARAADAIVTMGCGEQAQQPQSRRIGQRPEGVRQLLGVGFGERLDHERRAACHRVRRSHLHRGLRHDSSSEEVAINVLTIIDLLVG